jgi:predicted negative regulator of RcsB-dependent stress response
VEGYISEQEQVEVLKTWWKNNGRSVITGLVLGFAAIFGWRTWQGNVATQMEGASQGFQQMMGQIVEKKPEEAKKTGNEIVAKFEKSPYAVFASLALAKLAVEEAHDLTVAKKHLQWALEHVTERELIPVIRMRLARIHLAEGNADQALAILQDIPDAAAAKLSSYQELKGDVLAAQGKTDEARRAYVEALALQGVNRSGVSMVEMKLNDLGEGPPAPTESP